MNKITFFLKSSKSLGSVAFAASALYSSVYSQRSLFDFSDLSFGNRSLTFAGKSGLKPVVIVTISDICGMWFQSGRGKGCSAEEEQVASKGGWPVNENGIVRTEFNEFNDQDEGD